jgi:hypothetical protein
MTDQIVSRIFVIDPNAPDDELYEWIQENAPQTVRLVTYWGFDKDDEWVRYAQIWANELTLTKIKLFFQR